MNKKPITIISNDYHLKLDNGELIKNIIYQLCNTAKELQIKDVCIAGDFFDSRISQRLNVLNDAIDIFDIFYKYQINCHIIPGNHCKTSYKSNESFIDVYKFHPIVNLYDDVTIKNINGIDFTFVPFWEESILLEKLKSIKDDSIIISHFGLNESINNDGSKHDSVITKKFLNKFKKVFLGHFHQAQNIGNNIHHLPSLYQANYGEDELKGFTVLYDDLSFDIKKSKFPRYVKHIIDLNKESTKQSIQKINKLTSGVDFDDNIRFEFRGDKSKLDSFNNFSVEAKFY